METLAGLPYLTLAFGAQGEAEEPDSLCPPDTTDLIVLSHGWKNDAQDARTLYEDLVGHMLEAAGDRLGDRRVALVGVTWPAFRYLPDLSLLPTGPVTSDGGGAAAAAGGDVGGAELRGYADEIASELGDPDPAGFAQLAVFAAGGGGDADDLIVRLRSLATDQDVQPQATDDHAELFRTDGRELVERFRTPPALITTEAPESEAGGGPAASLTSAIGAVGFRWLSGGKSAVATVLNQFTYYEMKARAGTVGVRLAALLDAKAAPGVRIHLIGHSFGARLVTAAASAAQTMRPASLVLLQGAYSHNGLGQRIGPDLIDGAFRNVVAEHRVSGPITITHTRRDTAVGFFYALASTISRETAAGLGLADLVGGPDDLHGGMGANGALALLGGEGVSHVAEPGAELPLQSGTVNNVLADKIISDHNDVANADAGRLVWTTLAATG